MDNTVRIENAVLIEIREQDYAQRFRYGGGVTDCQQFTGRQRAPGVRLGNIGRLVYRSDARSGWYRFASYGTNLNRFWFLGGPTVPTWQGVRFYADRSEAPLLRADVVFEWRENDLSGANPSFWVCTHNTLGSTYPRVFGSETLYELLAVVIEPPLYIPLRGDTLIIHPEGAKAGVTVKGRLVGCDSEMRCYTVESFEDGREYTGERVEGE